jgi:hypothetical protein
MTSQAGSSIETATTPNTIAVTTPSGDPANTTVAAFQVREGATYWTAEVSLTQRTYVLAEDTGVDVGTWGSTGPIWKKGFEVQFVPMSAAEYGVVIAKGSIIDGTQQVYEFDDFMIGVFAVPQSEPHR